MFFLYLQQYGLEGVGCLLFSYINTKIFFRPARLLRLPVHIRGRKLIRLSPGVTFGRSCRLDAWFDKFIGFNSSADAGNLASKDPAKIILSQNVQIGDNVQISSVAKIAIGESCLIASYVFITDHDHGSTELADLRVNPARRDLRAEPVCIGRNTWIGQGVSILKGVTIGESCIIAAGAVVTKSIPSFSVAAGVPAKIIKSFNVN
jgi:lipopolysaccharide O-acetyltransferase